MSTVESGIEREDNPSRNPPIQGRGSAYGSEILMGHFVQMKQRLASRTAWPPAANIVMFGFAFLLACRFDRPTTPDVAIPIRFSDAVLLCGFLLSRPNQWWRYLCLFIPIRLFLGVTSGTVLWLSFASSATDCLKGMFCAWLLRRVSLYRAWFDTLFDFGRYSLVTVILGPAISAFASGVVRNGTTGFWEAWKIGFLGDALAGLIVAPLILFALDYDRFALKKLRDVEAPLVAAGLVFTTYLVFRPGLIGLDSSPFLLYLPLPFLIWAAMQFGPLGASGALLLMSILATLETRAGQGPFHLQSFDTSLVSMQLFLFFGSVPIMSMSVITFQRWRVEARLKDREEHLRSVVNDIPVMVWMSGTDGRCTFFNKPWLDFTGLSAKQQIERDWVTQVHPDDRKRCVMKYLSAFKSREDFTLEYRVLHKDGTYRWVLHNGVPRYGADGNFLGYVGGRIDFTEHRRLEEHLRKASSQVINAQEIENCRIGEELHEDLAQKVFALSIGLSSFSRKNEENRNPAGDFDQLQEQVSDVCKDIVRLSHRLGPVTVGGLGLPAALRNLCTDTTSDQRPVIFVQSATPSWLPADVSLPLYRVAQESLQNALTHSGASCIHVELSVSDATVRLCVRDNGCGFVVEAMTKPGLGLAKMSERMRNSGGDFSVTSSPGEGTAVIATLPLRESVKVKSATSAR
jgi:PAS domain S-box-containing protein